MASDPVVELWTLYAIAVSFTILRTYARISTVGFSNLQADDYLIWLAMLIYSAQCALGYNVGVAARGLANNGMTPEQRAALSVDDPEYTWRVIGSKIQVAGWTTAQCLLWTLKLCMTLFYLRLTNHLKVYRTRIRIAMALIASTFIAIIFTIYLSCRPFHHYWQINPDPGNSCQAAISYPILWVTFISNVTTDLFLLFIPIPMLWNSSLRLMKKIGATLVLSAGVLIIIFAVLKSIFVIIDPINGGKAAAEWGTRETFVAIVTTNLPMIFPLLKTWFSPYLNSTLWSTGKKDYATPKSGLVTIGSSAGGMGSRIRPSRRTNTNTIPSDNESEEHIIKDDADIRLHDMRPTQNASPQPVNGIMISKQVSITRKHRDTSMDQDGFYRHAV